MENNFFKPMIFLLFLVSIFALTASQTPPTITPRPEGGNLQPPVVYTCTTGLWGENCTGECHCLNGDSQCDSTTGICEDYQCDRGWTNSPFCQTECSPLTWGSNCEYECHCPEEDTCSSINGLCDSQRCHVEWTGPSCQIRVPRLTQEPRVVNISCSEFTVEWDKWNSGVDIGDITLNIGSYWIQQSENGSSWTDVAMVMSVPDTDVQTYLFVGADPYTNYGFRITANRLDSNQKTKRGLPGPSSGSLRPYTFCIVPTTEAPTTTTTTIPTTEEQTTTSTTTTTTTTITTVAPTTTAAPTTTSTTAAPTTTTVITTTTETPTTTAPNPPGPVRSPLVNVDQTGFVEIAWSIPANLTHEILGYNLTYQVVGIGDCNATYTRDEKRASLPREIRRYVIADLLPWRRYRLTVMAVNVAGLGEPTEQFFNSHEKVPTGAVNDLRVTDKSSTSLQYEWSPPACAERGGLLLHYRVTVSDLTSESNLPFTTSEQPLYLITGLVPYRRYGLRVEYVNSKGVGPDSGRVDHTTEQDAPPAPAVLRIVNSTDTSMFIQWSPPYPPNGRIKEYRIIYWSGDNPDVQFNMVQTVPPMVLVKEIANLKPYLTYYVEVQARNEVGAYGNKTAPLLHRTGEGIPGVPENFRLTDRNTTCLIVAWEAPAVTNGDITHYRMTYRATASQGIGAPDPTPREVTILASDRSRDVCNLEPATQYNILLEASTAAGYGAGTDLDVWTWPGVPEIPPRPEVAAVSLTTVTLLLNPAVLTSGPVSGYFLVVEDVQETRKRRRKRDLPDPTEFIPLPGYTAAYIARHEILREITFVVGDGTTHGGFLNKPLITGRTYNIMYVVASELDSIVKMSFSQIITPVLVDTTIATQPTTTTSTASTTTLTPTPPATNPPTQKPTASTQKPTPQPTEATTRGGITGAPSTGDEGGTNLLIIILPVVLGVIIIVLLVILLIYCLRKKKDPVLLDEEKENPPWLSYYTNHYYNSLPKNKKMQWSDTHQFDEPRFVTEKEEPNDYSPEDIKVASICNTDPPKISFPEEYRQLAQGAPFASHVARRPHNQDKNRFDHILAYDHSRVILQREDGDDYINASYVAGYDLTRNLYISAQSPYNDVTICDFWYMVFQENVSQIVFCSRLVEDGIVKSEQYWPSTGESDYDGVGVRFLKLESYANYVVRRFDVTYAGETKRVRQYQFTSWPNHGVPDDTIPFLEFRMKVVTSMTEGDDGPLLVHCGTGVSRSAVFIAVDQLLEQAKQENVVNVFKYCSQLRKSRPIMVRTLKQYIFIYDALLEALITNYNIVGDDMKVNYRLLSNVNPVTDKSYFKEQYEVLEGYLAKLTREQCKAGSAPENAKKNRFDTILPPDRYRPVLKSMGGKGGYVNALYQDTYRVSKGIVMTQTPLANTVADFWRLVYALNINTIVMLNSADYKEETCCKYWPTRTGQQPYEPFLVNLLSVEEEDHVTIRNIRLTSAAKPGAPAREVRQFQFESWRMYEKLPWSREGFIQLLDMVDGWREETEQRKSPILMHCCDGGSQSGLFAACYVVCEKMKMEGEVDIFHTIKHMKRRRLQIVNSLDQYKFVFKLLWDYMNTRMKTRHGKAHRKSSRKGSRSGANDQTNGHVQQRPKKRKKKKKKPRPIPAPRHSLNRDMNSTYDTIEPSEMNFTGEWNSSTGPMTTGTFQFDASEV